MTFSRASASFIVAWLLSLGGCATRQVNSPIAHYDPGTQHQFEKRLQRGEKQDLVVLAFSGGGTRAAAFSYGALEALRRIEIVTKTGRKIRLLDEVDVITGVSGGRVEAAGAAEAAAWAGGAVVAACPNTMEQHKITARK